MNGDLLTRVINVTNHLLLPGWSSEYCSLRGDKNKPLGEEHDMKNDWLVVWNMTFIFPSIWNVIIPTDFHICQRGWNHQPEDVRFSTRGKVSKRKLLVPPFSSPLKSLEIQNCSELLGISFGVIKHGWKIWGFWNPRPDPKIPTSSRWWWAVTVSQKPRFPSGRSWKDGSLGKPENFAKTWRHVFFGWEHVGEFFLPKKGFRVSFLFYLWW